jgi:TolA-binding protein
MRHLLLGLFLNISVFSADYSIAQSSNWDRYMEQHQRDLDWVFQQDQMRRQQEQVQQRLDQQQRQIDDLQRQQSMPSAYPPCSLQVTGSFPCDHSR